MPQMAPLNWLILFIYFSMIFLMFNSMNFFQMNYQTEKKKMQVKKLLFNWKW